MREQIDSALREVRAVADSLWWLLRNTISRRKCYTVSYWIAGEQFGGDLYARSWEEALGACISHGYRLEGKTGLIIKDCRLAHWLAGMVSRMNG